MRGLRHPQRHGGHETLAPRNHAPIFGRDGGQHRYRFVNRTRGVVDELAWFHPVSKKLEKFMYFRQKPSGNGIIDPK